MDGKPLVRSDQLDEVGATPPPAADPVATTTPPPTGYPQTPKATEPQASAAPFPLGLLWSLASGWKPAKILFTVVFLVVATFHFKNERLAREAKDKAVDDLKARVDAALPPPVPADWDKLSAEELAKLGFRRVTQEELDAEVAPGKIVVLDNNHSDPGYRVAGVEGDWLFVEDVTKPGRYTTIPRTRAAVKKIPLPMPDKP